MAITTTSDYKTYAGISGSSLDSVIALMVSAAQSIAESFCDRLFDSATYTEKYDGKGSARFVLRNIPVASITSVTVTGGDGTTDYTLASTEFKFDGASGIVELTPSYNGRFAISAQEWGLSDGFDSLMTWGESPTISDQFKNITAVYVGGYSSMPSDLVWANWRIIDAMMAKRRRDGSVMSESLGAYSVQYGNTSAYLTPNMASMSVAFGADVAAALSKYKRGAWS